ncbi:VTT domain-containing protein [Scandinavium sp. V105_16]|uniref:TVP38/TMEM64 family membrane protein n=1 Tax=Scandinavium lactucae TaxID=3095028 RepID=A0AAJ2S6Y0_9ENTR|nr:MULTISPECIES: VTT domain-containing protein [unclassified Scandinavium]MDX6022541.1 VTT domain-containing protein [Scandinavium sp. V105_16]MDX6033617.1 VTT domain-containing protein [Scandinavium sp. V105_12]MDX6042533.1 VTT domain-containing protein [Scandinavium sp. V105_6]MDX6052534.1 VTT domain-containing protein [Scandinavium sp. V105_1]
MNTSKIVLLALLAACMVAGFAFLPRELLTLSTLQHAHAAAVDGYVRHPLLASLLYFLVYVLITALSIPGATLLTLLGAAVLPFWLAALLVSFASTFGALLAMLVSRYLLAEWVSQRFARQMATVNAGIAREGAFYLFALRLTPLLPFFVVNLLAGITRIGIRRYWWVSQLGMLPATLIYLNAGRQLSQLHSLQDILSPGMLLALTLIGVLPLVSRRLFGRFLHR